MKLQEKLDAYKKGFLKQVPEDALKIMHRATEDLRNSGIMETAVEVGDQAPDFSLENIDGKFIRLTDALKEGPVVLGFYRGKW
jgi:hypothetical protein